jgi:tetratricopeptide (TPR) repeat protein
MDSALFFLAIVVVLYALYRLLSRRMTTPEARVRGMLRRHHALQRLGLSGLSDGDCLYRQLTSRSGWRKLPPEFIAELVARLQSKENVFRFVSLAEDHRLHAGQLSDMARSDREAAMREVALWLASFGKKLQVEERYKEAEFVQKLALQLEPEASFALLPLAATYYKTSRYADAAALFRRGLEQAEESAAETILESHAAYQEMYEACVSRAERA